MNQKPSHTALKSLLLGLLLGAAMVAVCVAGILTLWLLGSLFLLLLIAAGFGGLGTLLTALVVFCVGLVLVGIVVVRSVRWALRKFASWRKDGWTWAALGVGVVAALALAFLFSPFWLKDMTTSVVTGESIAKRASLPASEAEIHQMRTVVRPAAEAGDPQAEFELGMALLHGAAGEKRDREIGTQWIRRAAAQPQGIEARLLLAVQEVAAPIPEIGRMRTSDDVDKKVAALLALRPTLPKQWLPVMLGSAGLLQPPRYRDTEQPMRDRLAEAGQAGSRVFRIFAAQIDESTAKYLDENGRLAEADIAWHNALEGYAQAGDIFEVERLRDSPLSERLHIPDLAEINDAPRVTDVAFSGRLLQLALTLYSDQVAGRAAGGDKELATAATLLAIERTPDPMQLNKLSPARGWLQNGSYDPLQRWLLVLRHAHGDCIAVMPLADLSWRVGTASGYAWALAWGESAERCARTEEEQQQTRRLLANVRGLSQFTTFAPGQIDAARAGVATMIARLR